MEEMDNQKKSPTLLVEILERKYFFLLISF